MQEMLGMNCNIIMSIIDENSIDKFDRKEDFMRKIITKFMVALCIASCLTGCGKKKAEVEPQNPVEFTFEDATANEVKKSMDGKEPDEDFTNEESGIQDQKYKNRQYAGYMGDMDFYYSDSKLMYYQWATTKDNVDDAKEVYKDVAATLKATYGEGEEKNNEASEFYTTSYKDSIVVLQLIKNENNYEISFKVTGD